MMSTASLVGVPFSFILEPINEPDIVIHTDASSKVGIGGWSNLGHFFQNKWTDISSSNPKVKDIQWRELSAIYVMMKSLENILHNKIIHIYTDNEAVKYMLIKMRAKLYRPDLQILINDICKSAIKIQYNFWIDHIPGKEKVIADNLSRFYNNPFHGSSIIFKYKLNTIHHLQNASDLSKNFKIDIKNCIFSKQ